VIDILRKFVHRNRARGNRSRVTRVGDGTQLSGLIDRRAAGAEINIGAHCLIQGEIVAERNESRVNLADRVLLGGGSVIDCALSVTVNVMS
jgi:hypothetical protein